MSGSRELVLARVRRALDVGSGAAPAVSAGPSEPPARESAAAPQGAAGAVHEDLGREPTPQTLIELLTVRLRAEGVEVLEAGSAEVGGVLDGVLAERGASRIVVPPGLPPAWRPRSVVVVDDTGLTAAELDRLDGAITGCTLAVAETGTLLLTAGPVEGRRALTLVPDLYVCVVETSRLVADAGAALAAVAPLVRGERRPLTFVSGPSATSDIELHRVQGVHGPRRMVVVLVSG